LRRPLAALVLALLLALLLGPAAARPLVYCTDASPEGFDPGLWDAASTNNVNRQRFQGLGAFQRGGTALVPRLAERWSVSPDARVFTFFLRKGVRFHATPWFTPTRELDADDVLFTFGRFLDPAHPFNKAFPAQFVYPQNLGLQQVVERLEKLDAMTLRFTLKQPNVAFPSWLAMAFAGIHSAEYGEQLLKQGRASAINSLPVGTGPYRFTRYRKDEAVRMEAHPGYWGAKQKTDKLVFAVTPDATVRLQKLLAGECQVAAPLREADLPVLQRRRGITVMTTQALNVSYLSFNMRRLPTSLRAVREALDIAIDRDALFKALFPRGDAMQAVNPFPPMVPGYNRALKNEHDPQRAQRLLAEAGYPNGALVAQMIQHDWARIGVKASIRSYEWGEYLKRAAQGEHDVYMSGWTGETGDADDFLTPTLTCAASSGGVKFCDAGFDRLVAEARATPDPARRGRLYEQAQVVFKRERPWITLAHSAIHIPLLQEVQGFVMQPNGGVDFENVWR
jgi:peptide/nickel transport system substrate-binding protein/dipeptide transport system substrate-binding protein